MEERLFVSLGLWCVASWSCSSSHVTGHSRPRSYMHADLLCVCCRELTVETVETASRASVLSTQQPRAIARILMGLKSKWGFANLDDPIVTLIRIARLVSRPMEEQTDSE
jgi:hypothetical protein